MNIQLIEPIGAVVAGILVFVYPESLGMIVGIYLIASGGLRLLGKL